MDDLLNTLAFEAKNSFASKIDFSDDKPIAKASLNVLKYLDKFNIGPAILSLLIVFAFPEKSRNRMWGRIKRIIRENQEG